MKREEKRQQMKARLIDAASARIARDGLANLRARDVAADTGCALGSIYTIFSDLDDLIVHVNARTLGQLGETLAPAGAEVEPRIGLRELARDYASFARGQTNLWAALFDHKMADGGPSPDWLLQNHTVLLDLLAKQLRKLHPSLTDAMLNRRARTYFAAVHGIVAISLQKRFLGLADNELLPELDAFVDLIADGSG